MDFLDQDSSSDVELLNNDDLKDLLDMDSIEYETPVNAKDKDMNDTPDSQVEIQFNQEFLKQQEEEQDQDLPQDGLLKEEIQDIKEILEEESKIEAQASKSLQDVHMKVDKSAKEKSKNPEELLNKEDIDIPGIEKHEKLVLPSELEPEGDEAMSDRNKPDSPKMKSVSSLKFSQDCELPTYEEGIDKEEPQDPEKKSEKEPQTNVREESKLNVSFKVPLNATKGNYCRDHNQKIVYQHSKTKKFLCKICVSFCKDKSEIEALQPKIAKEIIGFRKNLESTQRSVNACGKLDMNLWKDQILQNLDQYFKSIERNMEMCKKQAVQEVQAIFDQDIIKDIIDKKAYLDSLCQGLSDKVREHEKEFKKLNYVTYLKKEKEVDLLKKSMGLCAVEAKQYQSRIVRKEPQLSALIAQVKAMALKIEDALFSTVFSKVQGTERTDFDQLFQMVDIDSKIPSKIDVTPLYCFYREFIKGKKLNPVKGAYAATKKWNKIPEHKQAIFLDIARKHNESCLNRIIQQSEQEGRSNERKENKPPIDINGQKEQPQVQNPKLMSRREQLLQEFSGNIGQVKVQNGESQMKNFGPIPDPNNPELRKMVGNPPPAPQMKDEVPGFSEKFEPPRRRSSFDLLRGAPGNLKVIEKRILQKELEKKLDPSISSQYKSLQEINMKKREEKFQKKQKMEEEKAYKYQKSQLSRIHRIMRNINR